MTDAVARIGKQIALHRNSPVRVAHVMIHLDLSLTTGARFAGSSPATSSCPEVA